MNSSAIHEIEASVSQAMIDGSLPNERLQVALLDLHGGRYCIPLTSMRQALAHHSTISVADGLVAFLNEVHRRERLPFATLQILVIGFYRMIWQLLIRLDSTVSLADVRQCTAAQAAQLCYGFTFGFQWFPFPLNHAWCARLYARIQRFLRPDSADLTWRGQGSSPPPGLLAVEQDPALDLGANATRNSVLSKVFTGYFLDEHLPDSEQLIADLLFAAETDPSAVSFLQGIEPSQAHFRLRQVALALMAVHHRASISEQGAAEIVDMESAITCFLSPLVSVRGWLRANRERLSIPVVRQTAAGDAVVCNHTRRRPDGPMYVPGPPDTIGLNALA